MNTLALDPEGLFSNLFQSRFAKGLIAKSLEGATAVLLVGLSLALLTGCDSGGPTGGMEEPGEERPPETENAPPTAELSVESQEVEVGQEVPLDGSGSSDPDGDDLTYTWTITGPNGNDSTIEDSSSTGSSFTPQRRGTHEIVLEVSDGDTSDTDNGSVEALRETVVIGEDITENRTLVDTARYRVPTNRRLVVKEGATLTVDPGVEMVFESGAGIRVTESAILRADGTSEMPITMSATAGNEEAGWWGGLEAKGTAGNDPEIILDHTEVQHAQTGLLVNSSDLGGVRLKVTNSTFGQINKVAVDADVPTNIENISNTQFERIGRKSAVIIPIYSARALDGSNSFESGDRVKLDTGIDVTESIEFPALDAPYFLTGTSNIEGDTLKVEVGTDMVFGDNASLNLSSQIIRMEGSEQEPITLSASDENANDGWWGGVVVSSSEDALFRHVTIRQGGEPDPGTDDQGPGANIRFLDTGEKSPMRIENSTIAESSDNGILCEGTVSLSTEDNTFSEIEGSSVSGCAR